jgi:outer membrane lipoprotein-sorting protein
MAPSTPVWSTARVAVALALMQACVPIHAQTSLPGPSDSQAAAEQGMSEQEIFEQLVARNQARSDALLEYTVNRTYRVSHPAGKIHAAIDGRMEFSAPDQKRFIVTSEQGSGVVRRLALKPLISTEIRTAAGKDRHDSAITPANYTLELIGQDIIRGHQCYVMRAVPKRVDKYLFDGTVWVDRHDLAVVRIEGRPAASPSFWIKRARFVREYEKVNDFWLPLRDETAVDVRMYGKKILTIEHRDYTVRSDYRADAGDLPPLIR